LHIGSRVKQIIVHLNIFERVASRRPDRVEGKENSEITLAFFSRSDKNRFNVGYVMSNPEVIFTLWDDVLRTAAGGRTKRRSKAKCTPALENASA